MQITEIVPFLFKYHFKQQLQPMSDRLKVIHVIA